jgi:uncharacterized protein involved in tolerance to divalent cations
LKAFPYAIYYITINNKENAEKLANFLVSQKLGACCNLIGSKENI